MQTLPRRFAAAALGALLLASLTTAQPPAARAQTAGDCYDPNEPTAEDYGPTDISATSGNRSLSVAINPDATVTVFKWPSPSYYDQIKYRTTDRRLPYMGALPNEGALIGVAYLPNPAKEENAPRWGFSWLREWRSQQRYADDDSDAVITSFRKRSLGLRAEIQDVVAASHDILARKVTVSRTRSSPIRRVRVVAFANFNPVYSKLANAPVNDWCTEGSNDGGAAWDEALRAAVHVRSGVDDSTRRASSVAVGLGLLGDPDGFDVGPDTYAATRTGESSFDDSKDGRLSGDTSATGQADAAVMDELSLKKRRSGRTVVVMAAAADVEGLTEQFSAARSAGFGRLERQKASWWKAWLRTAPLPRRAPAPVTRLAKRSLISIRQATDLGGLIVSSISTQSPQGLEWVRESAFAAKALEEAGKDGDVEQHHVRIAALQASVTKPTGGETTPSGNWSVNYYADGVVGGTQSYEIDSTGLGLWMLWDHYQESGSRSYLMAPTVYEAIQRAAHYLTDDAPIGCRDAATGLQCTAYEDGSSNPQRTLAGAQAAWLGLGAAVKAARLRGTEQALENAEKWAARRDELLAAIRSTYLDPECDCFTRSYDTGGRTLWPVGLVSPRSKAAEGQARANWVHIRRALSGKDTNGGEEIRAVLGNAVVWKKSRPKALRKAMKWIATVPTTDETGLLGQAWEVYPTDSGDLVTMLSQPHVPTHAQYYLAALRIYGKTRWTD